MFQRALATAGALFLFAFTASAADVIKNSDCLECHSDQTLVKTNASGVAVSLFVEEKLYGASVHRTNNCVACHAAFRIDAPQP